MCIIQLFWKLSSSHFVSYQKILCNLTGFLKVDGHQMFSTDAAHSVTLLSPDSICQSITEYQQNIFHNSLKKKKKYFTFFHDHISCTVISYHCYSKKTNFLNKTRT